MKVRNWEMFRFVSKKEALLITEGKEENQVVKRIPYKHMLSDPQVTEHAAKKFAGRSTWPGSSTSVSSRASICFCSSVQSTLVW